MKKWGLLLSACLILAVSLAGCSVEDVRAIFNIARNQTADTITKAIGETRLLQEKAALAVQDAQAEIPRLQQVDAEERADAAILQRRLDALKADEAELGEILLKLADLVESGEPFASKSLGRSLTPEELKSYAETQMSRYQVLQQSIATLEQTISLHLTNAESASRQWRGAQQSITLLSAQLDLLGAKIQALELARSQLAGQPGAVAANVTNVVAEAQNTIDRATTEIDRQIMVINSLAAFAVTEVESTDIAADLLGNDDGDLANELRNLVSKPSE